jgi:hypothetical protein
MKRTMSHHNAIARPVDYFDNSLPMMWLVTDTNSTVRRDVIGLFNQTDSVLNVDYSCEVIGLDPVKTYHAFDFWDNSLLKPFHGRFATTVPPHSCRVVAVRADEGHPILLSTSRHVTQGMIDVTGENWSGHNLSAVSEVVASDPYELRIVTPYSRNTWQWGEASVSDEDKAAGVTISGEEGYDNVVRLMIHSPMSRPVRWKAHFARRIVD